LWISIAVQHHEPPLIETEARSSSTVRTESPYDIQNATLCIVQMRRVNCLPRPGSYRLCPVVVEVARGHSGSPYASLGAIAGLAYILAVALFRRRG
jgi:hypothetical protein